MSSVKHFDWTVGGISHGERHRGRGGPVADSGRPAPEVSKSYRTYALGLLVAIYTVNFLDRQVVTNLIEPIKNDLKLTDSQVGAMAGLWFAILYTTLGIPIARLADRGDHPGSSPLR